MKLREATFKKLEMEEQLFGDSSQNVFSAVACLRGKLLAKGTGTTKLACLRKNAGFSHEMSKISKVRVTGLSAYRERQGVQRASS